MSDRQNYLRPIASVIGWMLVGCGLPSLSYAYSPEDPEVRQMVDRGVKYLESLSEKDLREANWGGPDGQVMLAGYAHLKAEGNYDAPLVKMASKVALDIVAAAKQNGGALKRNVKTNYEVAVAIMLLADLDAVEHKDNLRILGEGLLALQMSHGGYGYEGQANGNVSQTQYVVLAMWTLDRAGVELSLDRVNRTLAWLLRVQDPSGYWTYIAEDPGAGRPLQKQTTREMSWSSCLAGGSAALIGADIFRLWGSSTEKKEIPGLPKAVKAVEEDSLIEKRRKMATVPRDAILAANNRMDGFRKRTPFTRGNQADWFYYMLYSMERYESFVELASDKPSINPNWYDDGVTQLMSLQDNAGAWGTKDKVWNRPPVCTSFAILFLIRGTKKTIGKLSEGRLAGGYTLPSDTSKIVVSGTQIKGEPVAGAVTDLLSLLESDDSLELEDKLIPEDLKLESDPTRRNQQIDRLERLLRGSESWQARRVAAKVLGSSDELRVVPTLIFALSDPDTLVRNYAVDGLRFLSRKFDYAGLQKKPDANEIREAQVLWRDWYLTIYPGYVFLELGL